MHDNNEKLTIATAHEMLASGDISATKLAESFLDVVSQKDGELNAYLEVFDDIDEQAERAQKMIDDGKATTLTGIPLAIKDNILVKGKTASAASKILENYTATYDATVITKLKAAGVVLLGRTNMDEFAMGSSTENSAFGITKNPHDTTRVPGGSSGGSAVAVAAGMALGALGSDTAGSIRFPASFCGAVGLKPTYGAVSRNGLIALGSSLDCIGPITNTVRDAESLFNAIKGKDAMDSTTRDDVGKKKDVKTIGVPRTFLEESDIDGATLENFYAAVERLKSRGYVFKDVELPHVKYAVPTYYIVLPAEASANLARFDGVKYGLHAEGEALLGDYLKTRQKGFGPEPRRRIILGTYVLSSGYYEAYYNKATAVRNLIRKDFNKAFTSVDVIATPTTPHPAFEIGEKTKDPVKMYMEDLLTVPANHTGMPAISIPSGTVEEKGKQLPLGLQLIAPHMQESRLFEVGKKFEASVLGASS